MAGPNNSLTLRELAVHGLLLLAALIVVFPDVFLRGEIPLPGGLLYQWAPWAEYRTEESELPKNPLAYDALGQTAKWYSLVRQSLDRNEWPLWNSREYTGMPLLANYQSAVFYPPRLVHTVADVYGGFRVAIVLKLFLCGLTAYIFGRGIRLSVAASRFLSFGWMLSMYNLTWTYWPLPDVSAWFPLAFLGVEWILDGRYRKGFFCLSLGATLMLLAGHPETAFTISVGLGLYFLARLAFQGRDAAPVQAIGLALGAWLLALAASAAQLIPFFEYLPHSYQFVARPEEDADLYALPPSALVALWIPRFFGMTLEGNYWGFWNSNYIAFMYGGIAAWFGCCAAVFLKKAPAKTRHRVWALAPAAALNVLLATNLVVGDLTRGLPLLGTIWRVYYMSFPLFALPLLGAIGMDRWFSRRQEKWDWIVFLPIFAVVAMIAGSLAARWWTIPADVAESYAWRQVSIALVLSVVLFLFYVVLARVVRPTVTAHAIVVVLVCDLLWAARDLHSTIPRDELLFDTELTQTLQRLEEPVRVGIDSDFIQPGLLAHYGVEQLRGYDGMTPWRIWKYLGVDYFGGGATMEPIGAIQYYLFPAGQPAERPEGLQFLKSIEGVDLYRNPNAAHRAFLVGWLAEVEDDLGVQIMAGSEGYDPRQIALTTAPSVEVELPRLVDADLGTARVRSHEPQRVVVDVEAQERCVLVLADAYFPGWRASIDGKPLEIFPVYTAFRGVIAPPGSYSVIFEYDPVSLKIGLGVSIATLCIAAIVSVALLRNRRLNAP